MSTVIDAYFRDIRKSQPLTLEQEQALARRIQGGDTRAAQELASANTKFVVTVARSYQGRGLALEDLISEGNLGLMQATYKYDPDMGFRFITLAVWYIRQSIIQAFSNQARTIRLPMNAVSVIAKVNKATELFESVEGRKPSEIELVKLTGLSIIDIRNVTVAAARPTSLSRPVGDDEEGSLEDLIEDTNSIRIDAAVRKSDLEEDVQIVLRTVLTPKEVTVVSGSFGIGCEATDDEHIGNLLGVSGERVRQLREKSLMKLRREPKVVERLRVYLG